MTFHAERSRKGGVPPVPVTFPESPSRPGRLVAATACPGHHETPGTHLGRPPPSGAEHAAADPVAGGLGGPGGEVVAAPDRGDVVGHFLFLEASLDRLELALDVLGEGDEEEALVEVAGFVEPAVVVVGTAQDPLVLRRRGARVGEADVG